MLSGWIFLLLRYKLSDELHLLCNPFSWEREDYGHLLLERETPFCLQ